MSAVIEAVAPVTEISTIKARQRVAWSTGNYAVVGATLQIVGESLAEALDLHAGEEVLDVAAGNGNASLAAARRFCDVTSTDYVPSLLEAGKVRAAAEGYPIKFLEADAENLPFTDASFDVVTSTFGVMFTPNQERAAAEMLRVCKPGGRIGLANWTPEGFVGQMFKTIGKYIPPVPGIKSPALWGTRDRLMELFGRDATSVRTTHQDFVFRYRSPMHWLEVFRTYYGPMSRTFAALDAQRQAAFTQDLMKLMADHNVSGDRTLVIPSAYLEVVIERMD